MGTLLNQVNWKSLAAFAVVIVGMIDPSGTWGTGLQELIIGMGGAFLTVDHLVSAYIEGVHTKAVSTAVGAKSASDVASVGHALTDAVAHLTATGPIPLR